jgi:hypothetical protein
MSRLVRGGRLTVRVSRMPVSINLTARGFKAAATRGRLPFHWTWRGLSEERYEATPSAELVEVSQMMPEFTPDGSRVVYTVNAAATASWDTWMVPVIGGVE